ncbi:MAG: UvrD-helicase domain-containing protein [Clostridia bacterium]|nr:UvrD-helicase domain-containing protein [Clostridia bacterium]
MELNDRQKEAVETTEGPVLVLAGAGSGKTRVLTERVAHLVSSGKAQPWEILAITFTNKAAAEMRERIAARVDFDTKGMWISTFHSMCVRILRTYADYLGYTSNFVIYDSSDAERLMRGILEDVGRKGELSEKELVSCISAYKNAAKKESFGRYAEERMDISADEAERLYETYEVRMREQNAMDFDDLLHNTRLLLEQEEDPREHFQKKFRYVMIDEYQDTNPVQYEIAKLLSGGWGNLFAVGDDDQSIYAFRGATLRNILEFEEDFPGAKVIRLEQNYRSTQKILEVANAIISENASRRGKTLWSADESGEVPLVYNAKDEREEASYICQDMRRLHEEGMPYSEMAVLYRTRNISRILEEKLNNNGIRYRVYGGQSFYERKEIKDLVAYLSLIVSPQSDVHLLRVINTPKRGIGEMKLQQLKRIVDEQGISYMDALLNQSDYITDKVLSKKAAEFASMYHDISLNHESLPVHEIVARVYERTGYHKMLSEEKTLESRHRMENIEELIRGAMEFDETGEGTFADYLQQLTLMTDTDGGGDGEAVTLMTMHAAKGLEFDSVYLAGMVENIFPLQRAVEAGEIEEERRLCYVAVTRAKKRLAMISTHSRRAYGRPQPSELSRFLKEIPDSLIRLVDPVQEAQEKQQAAPKRFMSSTSSSRKARPEPQFFTGGRLVAPKAKPESATEGFQVGVRVRHSLFGEGVITRLAETKLGRAAFIDYENAGAKQMLLAYAALEIVE